MANPLPPQDLEHIFQHGESLWNELKGERLFITGGTGFFGRWLLESFLFANDRLVLNARATVLTRRAAAFQTAFPHLAGHPAVTLLEGDVRDFEFPEWEYSHVIHAATESGTNLNGADPLAMLDTIIEGTKAGEEVGGLCGIAIAGIAAYSLLLVGEIFSDIVANGPPGGS